MPINETKKKLFNSTIVSGIKLLPCFKRKTSIYVTGVRNRDKSVIDVSVKYVFKRQTGEMLFLSASVGSYFKNGMLFGF